MRRQARSLAKPHSRGNALIPAASSTFAAMARWTRLAAMVSMAVAVALLAATAPLAEAAPAKSKTPRAVDPAAIVVTVGPIRMSMQEVKQAFNFAARADTSTLRPDAASVQRFVDSYVPTLLAQAYAMRDTTLLQPSDLNAFDMYKETLYRDFLRDRLISKYIQADEQTVRQVYENMKTQLQLAVIRVPTLVEVDTVRADLARGIPFEEVVRRRSRDSSTARSGGMMGWLDAIRFSPEQQALLWPLPVGAVSKTVNDPSFYSIYKVLARRDGPPLKDFATERQTIALAISKSQLGPAGAAIHDDLMAYYHYRVDPDAAEWLRAFLQKETATARRTVDPTYDKTSLRIGEATEKPFWSEAPLKGDDARRPVAFIDGDTLHALEVIDQLVFEPTIVWPLFDHVGDVDQLCDEAFYERIQIREAIRLGVKGDPEFIRKVTNRRGFLSWRAYRRQNLLPEIRPTDEELQALYARSIERFRIPERRRYVAVGGPTIELARQAGDFLREGMAPTSVGAKLKEGAPTLLIEVTPDTGMGLARRGNMPNLDDTIFSLPKGKVSEPLPDRGGYSVVRVDEILPARTQPFDEVRTTLENEVIASREMAAVTEIARKAASMFPVTIDRDALSNMDFTLSVFEERGKVR